MKLNYSLKGFSEDNVIIKNMRSILKKITLIGLFITQLVYLTGCKVSKNQIAYTVYPIGWIIERLGDENINYVSIQNDYSNVQNASLKDNADELLADSGVFLHIGNVEPYEDSLSETLKDNNIKDIDLSGLNAIYLFQRYTPLYDNENNIVSYIESSYYDDSSFDEIDSVVKDLYLWTNPISMLSMSKDILEQLEYLYPENASLFSSNYETLQTDLVQLDAQFQSLSNKLETNKQEIKFVSLSPSFGSWQKAYGVQVYPILLSRDGSLPDDTQYEVIKEKIIRDNVKYIAYEPNLTDEQYELFTKLETECNLTRVDLNNCSSLSQSQENDGKDYLTLMYENLNTLEMMVSDRTTNN